MNCTICNNILTGNQTKYCSNACKQKAHYNKIKEQSNTYHSQTLRGLKRKIKFINLLGGKCSSCGYKDNISALDFHHKNPRNKSFSLDLRQLSNTKESTLLLELNKCEILCANCHREKHYPEMELKNVLKIIGPVSPLTHNQ